MNVVRTLNRWDPPAPHQETPIRITVLGAAGGAGELRVTLGRFADYYGPVEGSSLVNQLLLGPASRGRTPRTFIADDQPHTFHAPTDAGRGFATLVEDERADGRTWILPAAPAITQAEVVALAADALGRPLRHQRVTVAETLAWLQQRRPARV